MISSKKFFSIVLFSLLFLGVASAQAYNFTNCGADGRFGPSQSQCGSEYADTELDGEVNIVDEGIQEWTVPESGVYEIKAAGAQGGSNAAEGAIIRANIELEEGDTLQLLVGQKSGTAAGGGGSFVAQGSEYQNADPLVVAGGGGGDGDYTSPLRGATSTCGTEDGGGDVSGGCDGDGGETYSSGNSREGGGGGGFYGEGGVTGHSDLYMPAEPFIDGGEGNTGGRSVDVGGFGGGSHGNGGGWGQAGGGGGGYSGGAGGARDDPPLNGGGGGGSFVTTDSTEVATSDGEWETTGTEPDDVYEGEAKDLNRWNEGDGKIDIEFKGRSEICNYRGPFNECVMNETTGLGPDTYNISSEFKSERSAILQAFNGKATIKISNSTSISGLWQGAFNIEAESPRIQSGASFRPEGETIRIGR